MAKQGEIRIIKGTEHPEEFNPITRKQEELQEGIRMFLVNVRTGGDEGTYFDADESTNDLIRMMDEAGVVIKVDRETTDYIKCPCDDCTAEHKLIDEWGYFCDLACGQRSYWIARCRGHQDMAGYVAVEPLIKGVENGE